MYLLDANIFIEAANTYYDPKYAPGFWDWILNVYNSGLLISITDVKKELVKKQDGKFRDWLSAWADDNHQLFKPCKPSSESYFQLTNWVVEQKYTQDAVDTFLDSTDYLLIAHAMSNQQILVTNETSNPESRRRVKIPDACLAMGVEYRNIYGLIRDMTETVPLLLTYSQK